MLQWLIIFGGVPKMISKCQYNKISYKRCLAIIDGVFCQLHVERADFDVLEAAIRDGMDYAKGIA